MLEQEEQVRDREVSQESLRNGNFMIHKIRKSLRKKIKCIYLCIEANILSTLKIIAYCSQNILIAMRVENIGGHNEQMQLNIWASQTLMHFL